MMNKIHIRKIIVAGALCSVLIVPGFAKSDTIKLISAPLEASADAGDAVIVPISKSIHWAEPYVITLSDYGLGSVFKDKDMSSPVNSEDFRKIVTAALDKEYNGAPDAITREAVVYELMKIWAGKTGQVLDEIPIIQMLIFSDTDEIDSKYRHGINLAYMKGIAKGRDEMVFDPKAAVTYGELAALVVNTQKAIANEKTSVISPNNPIMAGRFETRGSYEIKDGKVVFDFELMSHFTEPKTIAFGSGQQFEVTITNEQGEEVYRYSDGKFFTMALIYRTLNPGESLKWTDEWDMTDKEGKKLSSGKYTAHIRIAVINEEDSEKIDESQLTTTIEFELVETSGIMNPKAAKEAIGDTAEKILTALKNKDALTISEYVHPEKGVRFSPYSYVMPERDVIFTKDGMKNFFEEKQVYLWGYYDGRGDEILLTPSEYYDKFIYTADFLSAEKIGYNQVLGKGNSLENQFEVYDNPIVVEYYLPGTEQYGGIDWSSLRLVFEEYDGSWRLTGIIHNQWTI